MLPECQAINIISVYYYIFLIYIFSTYNKHLLTCYILDTLIQASLLVEIELASAVCRLLLFIHVTNIKVGEFPLWFSVRWMTV